MQATVTNAPGSLTPGCEPNCFLPSTVTIDVGGTVTWENPDTDPHTVTSGSVTSGPSGVWNSFLIASGSSFSHTFATAGTYPYFCIIHPWMAGTVVVGGDTTVITPVETPAETEIVTPTVVQTTVQNVPGSSVPGCEPDCFLPSTVTINVGEIVTWVNSDTAPHTTTSGSPTGGHKRAF